jgi:hypothetical protein
MNSLAMKLVILFLICSLGAAFAAEPNVRIVRHNKPVTSKDPPLLITNVIRFAESASVDASAQAGGQKGWADVLASDSFIHVTFTTPRMFRLPLMEHGIQREDVRPVHEILISLPEGHYPGIRLRSETNYIAVTKWQPTALQRLVKDPDLDLSTVKPYDHFYNLP